MSFWTACPHRSFADMWKKRIRYLTALSVLGIYYLASGEWVSWILLLAALLLPVLSLLLSLPAIFDLSVSPTGADVMEAGERVHFWLLGAGNLPLPPFQADILLESCFTGEVTRYRAEKGLRPMHCGGRRVRVERAQACDYLGLFAFRVRKTADGQLLVRPKPLPIPNAPMPESSAAPHWKPKPGGGFAENHELREYRPGDSLNSVHWKLSAKTGSLIVREPMEAVQGKILLTMTLSGSPEELDRKLGRLLWLGHRMLEAHHRCTLRVLTGQGMVSYEFADRTELLAALDALLTAPLSQNGSVCAQSRQADWQYHIGGDADAV